MPASARLLQKLRETLGYEATEDLVALFSEAGALNRAEVRELADLYLGRFDTRVEERLNSLRSELRLEIANVRTDLAAQGRDLMKWMFIFWAGTIIPLASLIIALHRL